MTHRFVVGSLAVSMVALVPAVSVWLLVSPAWLNVEYGRAGFPKAEGFTDSERMALAIPSTMFLTRNSLTPNDLAALSHRDGPLYAADEIGHLVDARNIVRHLFDLGLAGAVLLLLGTLGAKVRPGWRYSVARGIEVGGWLTAGLAVWLSLVSVVAWPVAFVTFHKVLFPAGNWQFSESSGLIRLFPEKFWFDSAVALLAMVVAGGLVAVGVGRRARRAA